MGNDQFPLYHPQDILVVRQLGQKEYHQTWQAMRDFTDARNPATLDECWLLEHFPVFTQGQNGKPEHVLNVNDIPLVQTDRGGQVTYHGPGQLMLYTLIDLKRKKINVRQLVTTLEEIMIDLLNEFGIHAYAKPTAPGVYIRHTEEKIGSIGLRIRKGCSYHGIAFNVNMDLSPFKQINPCGVTSLKMTQLAALGKLTQLSETGDKLITYFKKKLGYTSAHYIET